MKKILVLGTGLVGSAMVKDLLQDGHFQVTACDHDKTRLARLGSHDRLRIEQGDIRDAAIFGALTGDADVVLNAVPGHLGFATVKLALEAGKDVVDIAFSPEDPMLLDGLARERGCRLITDMGVAPGMSNVLAGHAASIIDKIETLKIVVGGLPVRRTWPFEYKAVFSPVDVLEEYTRPARFVVEGKMVTRPALSEQERMELPPVGTLEAFNSDGLRSLLHSIPAHNMVEKTLRYPGHAHLMEIFREAGFFRTEKMMIGEQSVTPMALTSALLFEQWKLGEGEADLTIMQVKARGTRNGKDITYQADLYDTYDATTGVHSMARTTGYAATAATRLLASGMIRDPGVILPEQLGRQDTYRQFLLEDQARRNIIYHISIG